MNKELFGVFGDYEAFTAFRSPDEFDEVVRGGTVTVGIRDPGLGATGRSATRETDDGACAVWGEAFPPAHRGRTARWLLEQYRADGDDAFAGLNGSYLAVAAADGEAVVATDPIRSWECFYTDASGTRVFGTDAAAVARTIPSPQVRETALLEFLHVGVVLGEKTCFERLHRLPLDSTLRADGVAPLSRFVYDPREFDYVDELARRLERAVDRRAAYPKARGLLLSAGYDSRLLLSQIPDLAVGYTVGDDDVQEVRHARKISRQYDATHRAFAPDERYLLADDRKVRYSQGIKESLHIHHAGYDDGIDAATMYHGLLCDTMFRGHFTERDGIEVLGKRVPFDRLDPNPEPVEVLLDKFGYCSDASRELSRYTPGDRDPERFVREAVRSEFETHRDRFDRVQNGLDCCGIGNQPSMPFHTHLADNYVEAFLAADAELLEWHLHTPPEHRTTETFLRACERLDPDLLRTRPPDRPHDSTLLNEVEGFVRRKTPGLQSFEPPWPDRREIFDRHDLDRRLLPAADHVHGLPARHKLRINDVFGWMSQCADDAVDPSDVLRRPAPTP